MTTKDYIVIAEALRKACEYATSDSNKTACRAAAECVANSLANDNPRFNREHFLAVVRGERELDSQSMRKRQQVVNEHPFIEN